MFDFAEVGWKYVPMKRGTFLQIHVHGVDKYYLGDSGIFSSWETLLKGRPADITNRHF